MELNYFALQDLFNDWLTAIPETPVSLRRLKIYRIHSIEQKDKKAIAKTTITDTWTMKQEKAMVTVPVYWMERLKKAGVFYKTAQMRYVPTDEVNGHILNDYFHITKMGDITEDEKDAMDLTLASRFRKMGQILFVARLPVKGYAELVGMRSACGGSARVRTIDIAGKMNGQLVYSTDYTEQETPVPDLDFTFKCKSPDWQTRDGTPFWLTFSDTVNGRRSIRIDVSAEINGREYIIDCMEVSHRSKASADTLAAKAEHMVETQLGTTLNPSVEAHIVTESCMKYVPKKTRKVAMETIISNVRPIEAAYDVMGEWLFNPRNKQHRTQSYDGGRRKYELALGTALKCC